MIFYDLMICTTLYGKTDICSIVFHHLRRSASSRPARAPHFPGTGIKAPAILAVMALTQVKCWQGFVMAESRQSLNSLDIETAIARNWYYMRLLGNGRQFWHTRCVFSVQKTIQDE